MSSDQQGQPTRQRWGAWRIIYITWNVVWFLVGLAIVVRVAWKYWDSVKAYIVGMPQTSAVWAVIGLLMLAWGARALVRRARKKFQRGRELAARIRK